MMRFLDPPTLRLLEGAVARARRRFGEGTDPSTLQPAWNGLFLARILVREGFLAGAVGKDFLQTGAEGAAARRRAVRAGLALFPGILHPALECLVDASPEAEDILVDVLRDLPEEVYLCDDGLGWAHQAWQADRKTDIQRRGGRIDAGGLGPVTQLFTDGYMTEFLLSRAFPATALVTDPAAPPRVLDPCCGAGAFLLAAMPQLVERWRRLRGGDVRRACDAVLENCLFGLEIDERCAELAVCSLVLAAWRFPGTGGLRSVPRPRIACCGHPLAASREDWRSRAGGQEGLASAMAGLWEGFSAAPILGSLVEPPMPLGAPLGSLLEAALEAEDSGRERQGAGASLGPEGAPYRAGGLLESARLLADRYTVVATNVPYLSRPKQTSHLAAFCAARYPEARRDLATVFVERCLSLCEPGGTAALVTPQNWLFLGAYREIRRKLLRESTWRTVVRLGEAAFGSGSATGAFAALLVLSAGASGPDHCVEMLDAGGARGPEGKRAALYWHPFVRRAQAGILAAEDARLVWNDPSPFPPLGESADSLVGLQNGDAPRYVRQFWELPSAGGGWVPFQGAPDGRSPVSGRSFLLRWEGGAGSLAASPQARIQGTAAWGRRGVAVRLMRHLDCALYDGAPYDQACAVLLPHDPDDLPALWTFCSRGVLAEEVRRIDGKLNVTNAVLLKAPFDAPRWREEARRALPRGLVTPRCDDPAQWEFHGNIAESTEPLQTAVARLLGYRWPGEAGGARNQTNVEPCDGILPLGASGECPAAADRLRLLLQGEFGSLWSGEKEAALVRRAGCPDGRLETYLRDRFFAHHLAVFRQRPFIWHLWDGRKDGFSALLLAHALDAARLGALIDGPLAAWIRLREEGGRPGDARAAGAARDLGRRLRAILEGEAPYDIFVRWKPLPRQPIGWDPDMDDGVRVNIRPFVEADVLRVKPRIRWGIDRGRDDGPWHAVSGGQRRNDLHLGLVEKKASRRGP